MKIQKGTLTMILIGIAMFSLFSCARTPTPKGRLVSVQYGGTSMSFPECFTFTLTEEDGAVYFSCDAEGTDGERIQLERVSVDPAVMEDFRWRALKSELAEAALAYRKPHTLFQASDAPTRFYTLTWEDGTSVTAEQNPPDAAELRAFFVSVAERYKRGTAQLPSGELVVLSVSASASWIEGCYSFELRLEDDVWLLSAWFSEVIQTADGYWDSHEIRLEDEPITPNAAETIRAAAERVGLREWLTAAENQWSADGSDIIPLDATTYSVYAKWDDGTSLSDSGYGDPPQDALLEALKTAAKEAANKPIDD